MLDFDGVLHPAQGAGVPEFSLAPRLAAAISAYRFQVVISSTWREHYPIERLRGFLPRDLGARVVDVLGPDQRGPHVRHRNIMAWVGKQPAAIDWRALDDAASEFPAGCSQLILCDGMTGVTERECDSLRQWLSAGS